MKEYPRYVTKNFQNFDPIDLANETRKIVCKGDLAKYTGFSVTQDYGGVVTGYVVGCCLRCIFCWGDRSRDFPESSGAFFSPPESFKRMATIATAKKIDTLRLSGAEPTLYREHLLKYLKYVEDSPFKFILETNGTLLSDEEYAKQISKFKKIHVRVSLKAGTPEEYARKTGATPESFELPFQAIRNLREYGVNFSIAAVSDPRIMSTNERNKLIQKLETIAHSLTLNIDEETLLPFKPALERIHCAGIGTWSFRLPYTATNLLRRIPSKSFRQQAKRIMYILFSKK